MNLPAAIRRLPSEKGCHRHSDTHEATASAEERETSTVDTRPELADEVLRKVVDCAGPRIGESTPGFCQTLQEVTVYAPREILTAGTQSGLAREVYRKTAASGEPNIADSPLDFYRRTLPPLHRNVYSMELLIFSYDRRQISDSSGNAVPGSSIPAFPWTKCLKSRPMKHLSVRGY